ncbi:MAG: hypothetical protein R2706_00030 [Acidimicrobiales bacterium]
MHKHVADLFQLARQNLVEFVDGQSDSMIADAVFFVVVRPDLFRPPAAADLVFAGR